MKHIRFAVLALFTLGCIIVACKKEASSGSTLLKIRMTDAPDPWDAVNVDIQQVRVHLSDDSTSGWQDLATNAGVYNLLDFQNGLDTAIAQGTVSNGIVKEIRLILGANNSVVVNGQTLPLTIPSGGASGLKIKLDKHLLGSMDSVLLDFDAALSVKDEGGQFRLRPVVRIK